jgi:hypothetical protein
LGHLRITRRIYPDSTALNALRATTRALSHKTPPHRRARADGMVSNPHQPLFL